MFLMSLWAVNRSTSEGAEALEMALHTLRMMALGGIHDHVAQVHTMWLIPAYLRQMYCNNYWKECKYKLSAGLPKKDSKTLIDTDKV